MARIGFLLLSLLGFAVLHAPRGLAETYPARPIKIVAGTAAGGQSDRLARLVGQHLGELLGESIAVENRTGADGMIAAEYVAQAPADGYTLLVAGQSSLVLAAALGRNLRYDPVNDFAPIGRVARVPLVLAVNANVPAATIMELVAIAKARPGALTYGTSGMVSRFATELLKASEQIDLLEIPYKSVPAAITDLLAGRIDMMFLDLSLVAPHSKTGQLRLLGAAGSRRPAGAPDLPTLQELGVRAVQMEPWFGLVAPIRTPPDALARLRAGFVELRRMPAIQRQLEQFGYEAIDDSHEQFAADIAGDIAKYATIARNMGLKGNQ
jgi:tripartite-type tricarboxylate transporter receptor subunit TctC